MEVGAYDDNVENDSTEPSVWTVHHGIAVVRNNESETIYTNCPLFPSAHCSGNDDNT